MNKIIIALAFLAGYVVSDILNDTTSILVNDAFAQGNFVQRIAICDSTSSYYCGNSIEIE